MQSNDDASGKKGRKIRGFHARPAHVGKCFRLKRNQLGKTVVVGKLKAALE